MLMLIKIYWMMTYSYFHINNNNVGIIIKKCIVIINLEFQISLLEASGSRK